MFSVKGTVRKPNSLRKSLMSCASRLSRAPWRSSIRVRTATARSSLSSTRAAALWFPRRTRIRTSVSKSIETALPEPVQGGAGIGQVLSSRPHAEGRVVRDPPRPAKGPPGGADDRERLPATEKSHVLAPFEGLYDVPHPSPQIEQRGLHRSFLSKCAHEVYTAKGLPSMRKTRRDRAFSQR